MRKSNVVAFVLSSLALGVVLACGSDPKPDPNVAMPSATPTTPATGDLAPDAAGGSSGGATSTGDAGGGAATADAGMSKDQQCEALVHDAHAEMDAEHIKVDTPCKKDTDCMLVKGSACDFTCVDGAIPKAEQKEWDREIKSVTEGLCKKWLDTGCKKPDAKPPVCTNDKKKAACDKGHCVLR